MTITENKQKLLEIAKSLDEETANTFFVQYDELVNFFKQKRVTLPHHHHIRSAKMLARILRRFVRTGVLEFKKSEVRE